jgi:hypothetical protein
LAARLAPRIDHIDPTKEAPVPATTDIPTSGPLLDEDFRYEPGPREGEFLIYSNNRELDLGEIFPKGFHGEVTLGVEGVHWAAGIKRDVRTQPHLYLHVLPDHRDNTLQILTNVARALREAFWPADLPDHTHVRATNVADCGRTPLNLSEVHKGMKVYTYGPGGIQVCGTVTEIGHDEDGRDALCLSGSPFVAHYQDAQGCKWYYADEMGLVPLNAGTGRAHWHSNNHTLPD